jgi:hypothetical protein
MLLLPNLLRSHLLLLVTIMVLIALVTVCATKLLPPAFVLLENSKVLIVLLQSSLLQLLVKLFLTLSAIVPLVCSLLQPSMLPVNGVPLTTIPL